MEAVTDNDENQTRRPGRPDRVILELDGKRQSAAAWARDVGVARSTLLRRVKSGTWSLRDALTLPPRGR